MSHVGRGPLDFVDLHSGMGKNVDKSTSTAQLAVTPQHAPIAPGSGTGSALFVINLCASIAPVRLDGNNIPGLENYRLYQVARNEDGRTRHRLRLGFFTSEKHAESVLTVVRQQYPTAFTACLCEEDRRFARGYLPESATAQSKPVAVQSRPVAVQPKPVAAQPAPAATKPAAAQPVAKQAATSAPAKQVAPKQTLPAVKKAASTDSETIELTWEPETPAKALAAKAASPAPAAKTVAAPTEGLDEFTWEPPSLTPAADAAIAKSAASGVVKAKSTPEKPAAEKTTSDTAKHSALKTSDTAKHPALKLTAKAPAAKPAAPVAAKSAATPVAAKPAAKPAAPPAASATKPDTASSMRVRTLDLTFSDPPPAPVEAPRTAASTPFHVGKGVQVKDTGISLAAESAAAPKSAAQAKPKLDNALPATKPIAAKPALTPAAPIAAKAAAPAIPPAFRVTGSPSASPPELDSTQTIRALTSAEMEDAQQDKWFAVQLAVSDQPVNLDAMPRLDIFEAYRLYSVATAGSGKIVHSLRLGFFKEAVSAEAVMGYLQTFFGSPTVMRVSVAEHGRFKDAPSAKRPAAPAHEAKVVEINNARATRPLVPTVTMEVAPGVDAAATGSFKLNETGSFNMNATGAHKALATGTHKALKSAAKAAGPKTKSAPRAQQTNKTGNSGRHRTLPPIEKKSLAEELLDEAREVEMSESGIRKLPKNDSLLSRMLGKLTK
jgi:hypothetical protein